jgi:hypothetical protein
MMKVEVLLVGVAIALMMVLIGVVTAGITISTDTLQWLSIAVLAVLVFYMFLFPVRWDD